MQMYIKAKILACVNNISDGRAVAQSTSQVGSTRDVRSNPHKGKAYLGRVWVEMKGVRGQPFRVFQCMSLAHDRLNILFLIKNNTISAIY